MIIVMKPNASEENVEHLIKVIHKKGLETHLSTGKQVTIIGVVGDKSKLTYDNLEIFEGVDKIVPVTESYKLSSKKFHPEPTTIKVKNTSIGPGTLTIIAGPCAVETAYVHCQSSKKGWSFYYEGRGLQTKDFPLFFSRTGRGRTSLYERSR